MILFQLIADIFFNSSFKHWTAFCKYQFILYLLTCESADFISL